MLFLSSLELEGNFIIPCFQVSASIWKTSRLSKLWEMNQHPADAQNFNILNNDKRAFY